MIIEEDKESDYSRENSNLPDSPEVNAKGNQLKKLPLAPPPREVGKADNIIIMSKIMTERCMLKFFKHFLDQDSGVPPSMQACAPLAKKPPNKVAAE